MGGYTTREAADLVGLTRDQVRRYVMREVIEPTRGLRDEYRFSFQDVVLLRTAKGLGDAEVSVRKTIGLLRKLKHELREIQSLSSVRIFADGNNVVVRDDEAVWNVESGQGHLDFTVGELIGDIASLGKQKPFKGPDLYDLNSDDWYNLALDLEEMDPHKAPEAYARSIALNPRNADAHVNLGRLFQLKSDLKRAKRHYQLALSAVPSHQLASYNMGTVFDELDEIETAVKYYCRAVGVPDAHYNLARIYELSGDEISSRRHLKKYRRMLDSNDR